MRIDFCVCNLPPRFLVPHGYLTTAHYSGTDQGVEERNRTEDGHGGHWVVIDRPVSTDSWKNCMSWKIGYLTVLLTLSADDDRGRCPHSSDNGSLSISISLSLSPSPSLSHYISLFPSLSPPLSEFLLLFLPRPPPVWLFPSIERISQPARQHCASSPVAFRSRTFECRQHACAGR